MKLPLQRIVIAFLAALWFAPAAWAGTTGKIAGRVTEAGTGEPLLGVQVVIEETSQGAVTDAEMEEEVVQGQEVVVTAERPIVQMDRTTTTAFVEEREIQALPVTNLDEIVELQAGVVDGHFRGGRGRSCIWSTASPSTTRTTTSRGSRSRRTWCRGWK